MSIDAIHANSGAASPGGSSKAAATLDYNAFLQLLIAQMKNQDPTEPMKSSEYVAQLSGFSNVEQSIQVNQQLKLMMQASFLEQAGSIVGLNVTNSDGTVSGAVHSVSIMSDGLVATLDSGERLIVGPGVTISR